MYKGSVALFSMDDKCKVPVGEPGCPIAAVGRGKQVTVIYGAYLIIKQCDDSV